MTTFENYRMTGLVATLDAAQGCGVVTGDDGIHYRFQRSDATEFDRLIRGARVRFTTCGGAKGPRAGSISPLNQEHTMHAADHPTRPTPPSTPGPSPTPPSPAPPSNPPTRPTPPSPPPTQGATDGD